MPEKHKRQFRGTSKPRPFFDRRVRITGNTKSLSLGKILPADWYYVRLEIMDRSEDSITLQITKLLESPKVACDTTPHKGSQ